MTKTVFDFFEFFKFAERHFNEAVVRNAGATNNVVGTGFGNVVNISFDVGKGATDVVGGGKRSESG